MRHMLWAVIAAVTVVAVSGTYAVADEKILVKYPHDHTEIKSTNFAYVDLLNGNNHAFIWNPQNETVITYKNDTYVPDIIHDGPWDIVEYAVADHADRHVTDIQLDGKDLMQIADYADVVILEYVQDQIDAMQTEIDTLQTENRDMKTQLDKQNKKIINLEAAISGK